MDAGDGGTGGTLGAVTAPPPVSVPTSYPPSSGSAGGGIGGARVGAADGSSAPGLPSPRKLTKAGVAVDGGGPLQLGAADAVKAPVAVKASPAMAATPIPLPLPPPCAVCRARWREEEELMATREAEAVSAESLRLRTVLTAAAGAGEDDGTTAASRRLIHSATYGSGSGGSVGGVGELATAPLAAGIAPAATPTRHGGGADGGGRSGRGGSSMCGSGSRTCGGAGFTICDVRRHHTATDCWLTAYGRVYDVTAFVSQHPGGARSILRHGGGECDEDFDFHSGSAQRLWRDYEIGRLRPCPAKPDAGSRGLDVLGSLRSVLSAGRKGGDDGSGGDAGSGSGSGGRDGAGCAVQ